MHMGVRNELLAPLLLQPLLLHLLLLLLLPDGALGAVHPRGQPAVSPWPSNQTDGNAAPPDWECHWRQAALLFGEHMAPWMTAQQLAELTDALELSGKRANVTCGTHTVPPVPPVPPPPPPSPSPPPSPAPAPPGPPLPVVGTAGCFDTHGLAPPVLVHQCREGRWAGTGNDPGNNLNSTVAGCARCCASHPTTAFIGLGGCDGSQCGTQCACLARLPTSGAVSETQCNVPCPGDHSRRCGGGWRYQLYNVSRSAEATLAAHPAAAGAAPETASGAAAATAWFVDPTKGADTNSGTVAEPFKSINAAIAASRKQQGTRTIHLRAGIYYDTSLEFGAADGGLTLSSYDGPGQALLTGGTKLTGQWAAMTPAEQQRLFPAASAPFDGSTVLKMPLAGVLPPGATVEGLQLIDTSTAEGADLAVDPSEASDAATPLPKLSRATRARYPNVESIETNLFPEGWIQGGGVHWIGRTFTDRSTVRFKNFSRTQETPLVGDPELGWRGSYQDYWLGVGGECGKQFEPPEACSCAGDEHTAAMSRLNGGLTHIGTPPKGAAGAIVPVALLPNAKYYNNDSWWRGAVVHGRPTEWYTSQFAINSSVIDRDSKGQPEVQMTFGRGGFGGNAAADSCGGWWLDNVAAELDSPNEFWFDPASSTLYYISNSSTSATPPPTTTFVALTRQVLVNITGVTTGAPLAFSGLRFAGAAHTFLASHGVPSGGDWTLANKAAVIAEDTVGLTFVHCKFERLDGSAILLRGRHRDTQIERNEFVFLGESGVAAWGRTGRRDLSDGSTIDGWDGTTGEQPRGVQFVRNLVHEIGHYQKQSSAWFQAQSCLNNISGNLLYNGPRALINFNDGFGGGSVVENNLLFNSV